MGERLQQNFYSTDGALAVKQIPHVNQDLRDNVIFLEKYRPKTTLGKHIEYLDRNWLSEGLSSDWYNIDNVGFSMKRQMRLLREVGDTQTWVDQVERDIRGFGLEYLNRGAIFPFEYQIEGQELVDKKYGNRKMTDTVDSRERNGAVLESLVKVQEHLLNGREGDSAVLVSPPGWTNLSMDDGSKIVYTDTMVFHFERSGNKVIGTTFRTDFNFKEAKKLVGQLTGQDLPPSATIIDCTKAVVLKNGDLSKESKASDLIKVLENVSRSGYAYKNKTWQDLRGDIAKRDFLYNFDNNVTQIINDFRDHMAAGGLTELQIKKALAATFLRFSKYILNDNKTYEEKDKSVYQKENSYAAATYGEVIQEVEKMPGCAGGGSTSSISSIINRSVTKLGKDFEFDQKGPCRLCGKDVPCGPCKICVACNDQIDMQDRITQADNTGFVKFTKTKSTYVISSRKAA
jgi:hypothetical protein